jgi:thymidylate synthase ThyX
MFTMNLRAARHIVQMRTSRHAEEEIRRVFDVVGGILRAHCPILFGDFKTEEIDGIDEWTSPYPSNPYDYDKES